MDQNIQNIVRVYKESIIQSEDEVRSKLIVPLLEALRYPTYLRAENFPIYGFEGRKKLPAKNADFILFTDRHFANYRSFSKNNIEWVYKNSLLVVEAKKPGEMPEILGQPAYYTIWSKAVAYLVTDGERVKGYFYNNINADFEVLDCLVTNLSQCEEIWNFSYENISQIKEKGAYTKKQLNNVKDEELAILEERACEDGLRIVDADTVNELSEEDLEDFPESSLQYMRNALGKNADGLSKVQLMARFLNTTDALLQNNLRYDVPQYILDFPRNRGKAYLYINEQTSPINQGFVTEFYWDEYDKFIFTCDYIRIEILYENEEMLDFSIGFEILDKYVVDRMASFEAVKEIINADRVKIVIDDTSHRVLDIPSGDPKEMWEEKSQTILLFNFWLKRMSQMRIIEEFYDIIFEMQPVIGQDNIYQLCENIDVIYDGIVLDVNCEINLPGGLMDEDLEIEEPMILEEDKDILLPKRTIHNICFSPYQSWILPGKICMQGTTEKDIIHIPGCCRYKVIEG